MKKEIEVWVFPEQINAPWFYCLRESSQIVGHPGSLKATLIIDEPEKKIELTESEFIQIFNDCYKESGSFIKALVKRLFHKRDV